MSSLQQISRYLQAYYWFFTERR